MDPARASEYPPPDSRNPDGVVGVIDHPLASEFWLGSISEPKVLQLLGELLSHDVEFHNGKIRNKPPGYVNRQNFHQDWPYFLPPGNTTKCLDLYTFTF